MLHPFACLIGLTHSLPPSAQTDAKTGDREGRVREERGETIHASTSMTQLPVSTLRWFRDRSGREGKSAIQQSKGVAKLRRLLGGNISEEAGF